MSSFAVCGGGGKDEQGASLLQPRKSAAQTHPCCCRRLSVAYIRERRYFTCKTGRKRTADEGSCQPAEQRSLVYPQTTWCGREEGWSHSSQRDLLTVPLVTRSAHLRVKTTIITSAYFFFVYFVPVGRQCILFTLSYFILSCLENCIIILCVSAILFVCVLFCFAALSKPCIVKTVLCK